MIPATSRHAVKVACSRKRFQDLRCKTVLVHPEKTLRFRASIIPTATYVIGLLYTMVYTYSYERVYCCRVAAQLVLYLVRAIRGCACLIFLCFV